ncbi:hypothetical protein K457DRAFT_355209 [Linnemannia elongata AG-77]|uniref:Transmembrane protein n=1 Tax=Linnemannia elongata AG-77 TaxID=1314771 RepID=A0A197K2V5_9FUNG|nr:hypothetical protein K457DRAFT_355209 [Linnemannia elongata AG-77]
MHLVVVLLNLLLLLFLLLDGILGDGISNLDVGGLPGRKISSGINSGGLYIKKCHGAFSIDSKSCPVLLVLLLAGVITPVLLLLLSSNRTGKRTYSGGSGGLELLDLGRGISTLGLQM